VGTTISCRFTARIGFVILAAGACLNAAQQSPAPVPPLPAATAPAQPETPAQTPATSTETPATPKQAPGTTAPVPPLPAPGHKPGQPPGPTFPATAKWSAIVTAGPVTPPLVFDGHILLALQSGVLSSRRVEDGKEVWSLKIAVEQPMAAADGRVFVFSGKNLYAINAADGAEAWKVPSNVPTAPVIARGGWVIVASDDGVTARRASDGTAVWTKPLGAVAQRPAIDGGTLYVPVTDGELVAMNLESGAEVWRRALGTNPTAPLAYGDRIYLGSDAKQFYCLDAKSGEQAWVWRVGTRIIGAATADEARVYFVAMDNEVRALARGSGNQQWKYNLAYRPTDGPVLMGAQLAVPGITGELIGVVAATGKLSGKLTFVDKLATDPAFVPPDQAGGTAAVVSMTGGLKPEWTLSVATPPAPAPPAAASGSH